MLFLTVESYRPITYNQMLVQLVDLNQQPAEPCDVDSPSTAALATVTDSPCEQKYRGVQYFRIFCKHSYNIYYSEAYAQPHAL